jgi:chromate transport protein ChrA
VACLGIFSPPIILITALSRVHTKIKALRSFRVVTKWFITGFLWILISTVISFGESSLINYKTWLIFLWVFVWVRFIKKDPIWAILATIIISLVIF